MLAKIVLTETMTRADSRSPVVLKILAEIPMALADVQETEKNVSADTVAILTTAEAVTQIHALNAAGTDIPIRALNDVEIGTPIRCLTAAVAGIPIHVSTAAGAEMLIRALNDVGTGTTIRGLNAAGAEILIRAVTGADRTEEAMQTEIVPPNVADAMAAQAPGTEDRSAGFCGFLKPPRRLAAVFPKFACI